MPRRSKSSGTQEATYEVHRVHERVEARLLSGTEDAYTGAIGYGRITNISLGGMYMLTTDRVDSKDELIVRFRLPDATEEVEARVVVRHVEPGDGMGLQFVSLTAEQRDGIEKYIREFAAEES